MLNDDPSTGQGREHSRPHSGDEQRRATHADGARPDVREVVGAVEGVQYDRGGVKMARRHLRTNLSVEPARARARNGAAQGGTQGHSGRPMDQLRGLGMFGGAQHATA